MDEPIDERNHAPGVGKHLRPRGERLVRGHERALDLITPVQQLEEQIGMAVGVGQVADFVDAEKIGRGVMAQAPSQCRVGLHGRQIAKHEPGSGEQNRVAGDECLIGDVLGQTSFSQRRWAR